MVDRKAPTLQNQRASEIHGRQTQFYSIYYNSRDDEWRVKDRWGHASEWDGAGFTNKTDAIDFAKDRARQDRPAMVADTDTGNTWKYPLRKQDIPDTVMPDEITDEERKRMRERLMATRYDQGQNSFIVED